MTCDYACCDRQGVLRVDGWVFCLQHRLAHTDERIGGRAPRGRPPQVQHGTFAGLQMHLDRGLALCRACADLVQEPAAA